MATIFSDDFESGDLSAWTGSADAAVTAAPAVGMSGSWCGFVGSSVGSGGYIYKTITALTELWFSLKVRTDFNWTQGIAWSTKSGATTQIRCLVLDTGAIRIDLGTVNIVNSAAAVISTNTVHLMEVYIKIADAGGRVVVKVDGVTVIDFTGDTNNSGGNIDDFRIGEGAGVYAKYYVDNVILDNSTWPGSGGSPVPVFMNHIRNMIGGV